MYFLSSFIKLYTKTKYFLFKRQLSKEYEGNIKECRELYPYIQTFEHYSKTHFNNKKPLPPPDTYPPRINLPFYVYITHDIAAPNLE